MNEFTTRGLVATSPRHLITQEGLPITSFRLASSEGPDSETNWFTVLLFNQLAINGAKAISKGDRVVLIGTLRVRDWDNGERTGTSVEIEADSIGHDMSYGLSEFTRTSLTPSEPKKEGKTMTKNTIKIEGQDNNVSSVIDALTGNKSVFMDTHSQTYIGAEVYGLTDNPRWFGAEINTEGEKLDNVMLDSFRKEFPNVNAEVAE